MTQSYCLDRHLDSAAAPPIATDLLELRGQNLCVDGTNVGFAGALTLQVLVAARLQWTADDCVFQTSPLSAALAKAAEGLGFDLVSIGAIPEDIIEAESAP